MKRLAEEMVSEGKTRDEKGELFYPVMSEPLVMAFFGAPEALYEVLAEKPGVALNLIMTNRALEAFWNQFEDVWIAWIDLLVEREMGTYAKDIYPFFVVQKHRIASRCREDKTVPYDEIPNFVGWKEEEYSRGFYLEYVNNVLNSAKGLVNYYVAYHDPITQLYMDLLAEVDCLAGGYSYDFNTGKHRRDYLNARIGRGFVSAFTDCIVVSGDDSHTLFSFEYQLAAIEQDLPKIIARIDVYGEEGFDSHLVEKAKSLAHRLTLLLVDKHLALEPVKPLKIDKSLAMPYRSLLLYDREQGLFNTPEKQKLLFVETLRDLLSDPEERETLIEKYGKEIPLSCAQCGRHTMHIDTLLKVAFCSVQCYEMTHV